MYYNPKPKRYTFYKVQQMANELIYLLKQSHKKAGDKSEVYWVYNRTLHDLSINNGAILSITMLNNLI